MRGQRAVVVPVGILCLTGSIGFVNAAGSVFTPLFQERTLEAFASVGNSMTGASDSDHDEAADFGPFDASVEAAAQPGPASALSGAGQLSEIPAEGIRASGDASVSVWIGAPQTEANASASSFLRVTFALGRELDYTLYGTFSRFEQSGDVTVSLVDDLDPDTPIHEARLGANEAATLDESGTLAPGTYTFEVEASAADGAFDPIIPIGGGVAYDLALLFPALSVGTGGEVPDGSDVPGIPVRVDKMSGGAVRLTWGPSCQSGDDDYVVYEGILGDPTSLAPVSCSTSGQLVQEFLPAHEAAMFLVVPIDGTREGSYGDSSAGVERLPSLTACLPQVLRSPVCP